MHSHNLTERVRTILSMAREDAVKRNHEVVDTEHILLALLTEGEGVATAVLQNLGADLDALKKQIETELRPGHFRGHNLLDLPFTADALRALEDAVALAHGLDHSYIGTEHLLLGLMNDERSIACQILLRSCLSFAP